MAATRQGFGRSRDRAPRVRPRNGSPQTLVPWPFPGEPAGGFWPSSVVVPTACAARPASRGFRHNGRRRRLAGAASRGRPSRVTHPALRPARPRSSGSIGVICESADHRPGGSEEEKDQRANANREAAQFNGMGSPRRSSSPCRRLHGPGSLRSPATRTLPPSESRHRRKPGSQGSISSGQPAARRR